MYSDFMLHCLALKYNTSTIASFTCSAINRNMQGYRGVGRRARPPAPVRPLVVIQAANISPCLQHYPTSPNNSSPPTSRQVWIFHCPTWPQQCSPLSTVFDLIKAADEEHSALGGPILALDRCGGCI